MNNKFWLQLKKISISIILAIVMASGSLLTGCFTFGGEDGTGVDDVLYGVRVTYTKSALEKGSYVAVPDEDFVKDLQQQYLDMAVEILLSLADKYGRGIEDFNSVKDNLPENFGEITLETIKFMEPLDSESNEYDMIVGEESMWEWGQNLNVDEHTGANKFASEFCNADNLFKMQVALYLINMGVDCMKISYGDGAEYFSLAPDKETLKKLASNTNITHSGLIEDEQKMLVDFILNNVIYANSAYYKSTIQDIITQIFEQTSGTDPQGNPIGKYPVVASVMVKDYKVQDIAVDQADSLDEDSEDTEDEEEDDKSEFFTMELGQQFYKSLVFMPKTDFVLNSVTLIFQSTEEINLTIYARLHEEGSDEYLVNEKVAQIHILPGLYDEIETDEPAEFEFDIQEFLKENAGITEKYHMQQYNQKTDVNCYGGLLGTGIGDGLVDKYGKAVKIATEGEDATLASMFQVTKDLKKQNNAVGNVSFLKTDSCYLEFVFETDVPAPFNIGYLMFDYEDPEED